MIAHQAAKDRKLASYVGGPAKLSLINLMPESVRARTKNNTKSHFHLLTYLNNTKN